LRGWERKFSHLLILVTEVGALLEMEI